MYYAVRADTGNSLWSRPELAITRAPDKPPVNPLPLPPVNPPPVINPPVVLAPVVSPADLRPSAPVAVEDPKPAPAAPAAPAPAAPAPLAPAPTSGVLGTTIQAPSLKHSTAEKALHSRLGAQYGREYHIRKAFKLSCDRDDETHIVCAVSWRTAATATAARCGCGSRGAPRR